ncbi:MAG: carbohydrate porin [Planctomycetes bacterium]|nr:carbohydrate porin [Planctomycetota bacterium]
MLLLLGPFAPAQDEGPTPASREWIGGLPFLEWTRATGDWGGLRTRLDDLGIEFGGGYTADWTAPWTGGLRSRDSVCTLFDVNAAFDLEALAGLPRTLAFVDVYWIEGRGPSGDVGDFQGVSNIAVDNTGQIAELWVETWIGEQFRVKAGKVDFNSEFAFNELGAEFVNSTAAITPCIVAYPTYPDPATAVNLFYVPDGRFQAGIGIYDGAGAEGISTGGRGPGGFFGTDGSSAYFLAAEVGCAWPGGESWGSGRAAFGLWYHTADFERFGGGTDSATEGFWLTLEQNLWRENPAEPGDRQGLGAYAAFGRAHDTISAVGSTFTCGVAWTGALAHRDHDVFGVAIHHADLSDDPAAGTPDDETVFEVLYKVAVTPAISLKPDLQYVLNPGGGGADDSLVALLRLEVLF